MTPEALELLSEILRGTPSLPGALCSQWPATFAATEDTSDPDNHKYAAATAMRLCRCCPSAVACRAWLDGLPATERPPGVVAGLVVSPKRKDRNHMTTKPITADDLRRAVRLTVAMRESDTQVQTMVAQEVQKLNRWMEMALATAVVSRTVLLQIDEEPRDEGALTMWLHAAIEQVIDGGAWWSKDDDCGDETDT